MPRFRAGVNKKDILALLATALTYTSAYSGHFSTNVTVLQGNCVLVFMLYCPSIHVEVSEICCGNRFVAFVHDANNWISSFAFSAMKTD